MKDFFISYSSADKDWAEWIAWQLEEAHYAIVIQAWDFRPGSNFVLEMQKAATEAQRTIAVLSQNYVNALFTQPEWAAAFGQDPTSKDGRLLPVRIAPFKTEGMLRPIVYIDLVDCDEAQAKEALLKGVSFQRAKPAIAPGFPGAAARAITTAPQFPGPGRNALKGLRPFAFEDAALFQRLQRQAELQTCFAALTDAEFRLGILFGESGCGKTSFVQAGLWPMLQTSASFLPVYVKFSELDPLLSLRQALKAQAQCALPRADTAEFWQLCEQAGHTAGKTLVFFFDQFEQFFVHFPREEQRQPFIAALAEWYRRPGLPAKILLCLRKDYYGHHCELQQALQYTLGPQESIELKKFKPNQAAAIFHVIAETAGLRCDRAFVEEMTARELAGKEEGRISPVDIQILAWMVSAQEDQSGFNRAAFRKLGGVEGLLENYLNLVLQTLASKAEREAGLKIMLALVDLENNVRAGVLSPEQIAEKLGAEAGPATRDKLLVWLASGKVRLLTPVEREGVLGYELAHERLIQPLRRLTNKQLTEVEQANRLLERRANEWLGNDRAARYLLTGGELRQINRQRPYLVWGKQADLKQELLKRSTHKWKQQAGVALFGLVLLVLLAVGWSKLEKMREQRQLAERRDQLARLLNSTDISPQKRAAQAHELTRNSGDPRVEVTTLEHMQFCYVPPGPFWMGSDSSDSSSSKYERPLHLNDKLDYGYWISRFPITVAQFKAFAVDSGQKISSLQFRADPDNYPVRYVTWHDAMSFCQWLTQKWRRENRLPENWRVTLPSEAEWEKAARGGVEILGEIKIMEIAQIDFTSNLTVSLQQNPLPRRRYPWGDQPDSSLANYHFTGISMPSVVGCFPGGKSPYGCEELAGNLWEWTRSLWGNDWDEPAFKYPYDPADGRENIDAPQDIARVLRGGAFLLNRRIVRCAYRLRYYPVSRNIGVGFRVVVSPLL